MKKLLLSLFFVTLSWASMAQTIKYVKPNGAGNKDGSSWANASDDLQDMINKSVGNFQDPNQNQIWVATGTYKPNRKADALTAITLNNRDNAFVLKADVKIYGGFPATGTPTMANRNWNINPTILSGDLGVANNNSDNAYHVVIGANDFGGQELNGFTITGANANGNNNITVNNRTIYQKRGAGVYAENTSFLLTNVQIIDNSATEYGGGIYNIFSSPILTNVSIIGNSAGTGGGLYNNSGSMSLTNASITGNTATTSTSELFQAVGSSAVNLRNSIVFGTSTNAVVLNSASVSYSLVSGISSTANDNINTTGLTSSQIFTNAAANNFSPAAGSPAINAGNNAYVSQSTDLAGNSRIQKDRVDIGAFESVYSIPPVPDANGVLYVKKNGAGNKTGSSWQHAIGELADALVAAKGNTAIKEVWVASGTYKPMYAPINGTNFTDQNRDNTFLLVNDVKIYGGFPATGTPVMTNRNWMTNPTVLSGDLGIANSNTDNAYHIVVVASLSAVTIDGFTIQGGYADGNTSFQYPGNSITRSNGAGLLITNSTNISINNCLISDNIALNNGAGIFQASPTKITNSRFVGNKALNNGGAMYNSYTNPIIINCSFTGNMATFFMGGTKAGAMYNGGSNPIITNCTFTGNMASGGDFGGIYNTDGAQPVISNSIFWNNQGPQIQDANGSTSTVTYSIVQGGFAGTGNLDADPLFVDAATGDYNLQATSSAINSGNNAAIPAGITTDLAGQARIQRNRVDLGAYESAYSTAPIITPANGIIYVKKGATGEGSSWQNATGELADALKFAKTNNAVATNPQVMQVWVAKGIYKPLYRADNLNGADATDRDNAFLLVDKVEVYGGFDPDNNMTTLATRNPQLATVLSGNLGANTAYHVVITVGATPETVLDGFTITEGNANGTGIDHITVDGKDIYRGQGGGMYNTNSSPTLKNCVFSINKANDKGGAMLNDGSSPILTKCSFTGNSVVNGNGFSGGGAVYNVSSSNPILNNCGFESNTARYGGAIYNFGSEPSIVNSNFKLNRANGGHGGAVYNNSTSPAKFVNCVFYANYADGSGGAFYNNSSLPVLTNCTFYGNTISMGNNNSLNGQAISTNGSNLVLNNSILWVNDSFIADGVLNGQVNGLNNFIQQTGGPASNPVASYTAAQLFTNATSGDLTLKTGSPAINAGHNSMVTTTKDFAGNDRIRNNTVDLGAYEVQSGNTVPLINIVPTNAIVYVKQGATGNGSSWTNATPELADALLAAKTNTNIQQIWVAKGAYKPLYSPADDNFGSPAGRDNSFLLVKDVKLYGGFAGTESTLAQRDLSIGTNKSILSGEIQGDAIMTNNAHHVVIAAGDVGSTTLDGFTVTNGSGINDNGSAVLTVNGFSLIKRFAGGIYSDHSSPLVKNCIITNNSGHEASGFGSQAGNPILVNTVISKNINLYNYYSNAFYAGSGSPKLVNVSIVNNEGTFPILALGNNSELSNSIVWGNTVLGTPQSFLNLIIKNSIVQGEAIIRVGLDVDPLFVNAANGDFSLLVGSPAIGTGDNNLYEAAVGNNSLATDKDLMGNPRLKGANIDLGAYELQSQPQHLTFAPTATIVYGTPDFDPGASSTTTNPITYISTNTAVATIVNGKIHTVGVGSTTIKATQAASPGYDAATAEQLLTITAKSVTVSIKSSVIIAKTYDGITNAPLQATDLTLANGDIVNGDNVQLNLNTATAQYDTKHVGAAKVISLDINPLNLSGTAAGNYAINKTSPIISANVGEITARAITVTAQTDIKGYDGTVTSSTIPMITSGTIAAVDQVSTAAVQTFNNKNTGTGKVITPTGLIITDGNGGNNYHVAYVAVSTGVITAKPITVTAAAKNKVYGDQDPALTYTSSPALVAGDNFTGTLTRPTGENIGNYAIVQGTLALSNNYVITYIGANLNISTKMVTVTAQAKNKMYGDVDPVLTYTSSPALAAGDNFTGTLTRPAGENIGNYAIVQGTLALNNNYVITYIGANLNISTKMVTVTAQAKNKMYGDVDPVLTFTSSPALVGGDNFTGALARAVGESVGNYAITQGTLALSPNYTINYTGNSLNITRRTMIVTADAKSKVYGEADPALTYTSADLIGADTFTGVLTRMPGENIGTYTINQGSLTAGTNYDVVFLSANFVINPKKITVTAEAKHKIYGDMDPVLTYNITGLSIGDALTGSLTRAVGENVGVYQINKGTLSVSSNYTLDYVGANFTIYKKSVIVTADAKRKTYGETDPVLSYTFVPALVAGNSFTGTLGRTAGENAGSYQITLGTLTAGDNYSINYQPVSFTIDKAVLLVKANDAQVCQGGGLPIFGLSYSGFKNGDGEGNIASKPTVSTTANNGSAAGNYTLIPSGGAATNYSFNYVNGTLIINALPQVSIASSNGSSISKGETLKLTASGGTSYSWSGLGGIVTGQNSAVLTIRPTISGTYTVTVTNVNGCSSQQTFAVTVRDDFQAIKATNLLSPNGDGINDLWKVDNIDMYPGNVVTVFDKGGRVLYSKKGYDNSWNGTVNGVALAEGTYYYVIDFGSGKLKQKGFITLLRESGR